jgi:ADP-ribosyl-[dinitrogen reductase] hydrolase
MHPAIAPLDRHRGCLLGLACGDAVGTTVEFSPRGSFAPLTDMVGGGPFGLAPGEWTDDTSMALCLGASLLHCSGFDARDQMSRYCNWRNVGYMSSNGRCFDIGITVSSALSRYLADGNPVAGSPDPRSAGNGALMRLAPIPMYFMADAQATWHYAGESTRTTHGAAQAIACSQLFAWMLREALTGAPREAILAPRCPYALTDASTAALAEGSWRGKAVDAIRGSGHCLAALEAAVWCFANTDSFESAVLTAANLGDDADTTAAICGQLAGAHYGVDSVPAHWLGRLAMCQEIDTMAKDLHAAASRS